MQDKTFSARIPVEFDKEWKDFIREIGQSQQDAVPVMMRWYMDHVQAKGKEFKMPIKHASILEDVRKVLSSGDETACSHLASTVSVLMKMGGHRVRRVSGE